jgi:large subunit ribosomal protein L28
MARVCELTGKKTTSGHNRPFSLKATKRTFRPNLFKKKIYNPLTGKVERMKLSAKAIRTLKKWAREGAAKADEKKA